jgi:serine/threonine protein kinase
MTLVASNAERINRFRLLRPLGQGAQGIVYAAYDPELDRQVAIKTLLLNGTSGAAQAEQFVAAAKTASSLSHPNIVPVFEVGIHAGQPFVVFEYVEGRTLAATLEAEGPLPMARAVVMMSQILAGMAHVHASGLLHGDIKPANILIGSNGIPRVTDFGIARPVRTAAREIVSCGTVQYTAPECLSEGHADYRSDVFALGLLFHEMLTGKPVYEAANEYSVIYRILNEIPPSPSTSNPRIDARLDDIVLTALQREPAKRYADAGTMKRELDRYRVPVAEANAVLREQPLHGTVEFLLRRMALKSDFPALTASFNRINQLTAQGEDASLKAISDLVMRDFALSQKLLRIVNSAAFAAGKVTKVSEAITLLGLSQLRAVATGMMLSSGGKSGANAGLVATALTDAFVAGVVARNLGRMAGLRSVEELFICGMFSRLGELLTIFYLRDEYEAIMSRVADDGQDSASASRAVLGLSFDELGAEVAVHWKFPDMIVQAMHALPAGTIAPPQSDLERLCLCAGYARELCTFARETPAGGRELAFSRHQRRYADAVPIDAERIRLLIGHSVTAALQYVKASGLKLVETPLLDAMRALAQPRETQTTESAPDDSAAATSVCGDTARPCGERARSAHAAPATTDINSFVAPHPPTTAQLLPSIPSPTTQPESVVTAPAHRNPGAGVGARLVRAWRALFCA